jgi:hypothetical protein
MKYTRLPCTQYNLKIGHVEPGTPVAFEHTFNNDSSSGDIFLRMNVCSDYSPRSPKHQCKTPVCNLRTGKLSYLEYDRRCRLVDCSVALAE